MTTSAEQPHEENSLDEILQLRGLRSFMKYAIGFSLKRTLWEIQRRITTKSRAYDANITKRI